jgi:cell pole-organizing protein PopZ
MDRADKVAAEAGMDDLLASIKRAIHDEGLEITEPSTDDELGELLDPGEEAVKPAPRSDEPVDNRRGSDSQQIIALRQKISRELNKEETFAAAPPKGSKPVPLRQPHPVQPSVSQFKALLGGDQDPGAGASRPVPRLVSGEFKEARPPQAENRQSSPTVAPRNPTPAYALRSAFDPPDRNDSAYRPPFGQGNLGIRGFQPPPKPPAEGMLSPETRQVAAGSFNRLAEEMFGREGGERSIDDLAREVLRPMLKQWLDQNLPRIVEQLVREEIERVARRSGR